MLKIMFCNVENDAKKYPKIAISTGKQYSVKYFLNFVKKELKLKIIWKGKA